MTETEFYPILLYGWYGLSALVFLILLFITAPYGRHTRKGWGPEIPSIAGWVIMELPAVVVPLICLAISDRTSSGLCLFCLVLWQLHYLHRTFVYPLRMRMSGKRMPLFIALTAFLTNIVVNYLVFRWLSSANVPIGVVVYLVGFTVNRHSDSILRNLRKPGETGYRIPRGGMYRFLSSPNYFGEILQWAGFAIVCWNLSALLFVAWSAANLVPRALQHHRWYLGKFPDYPKERKAILPFVV
jgi:protein-S-isoprenylcysteine O-methyltransferase Ste14